MAVSQLPAVYDATAAPPAGPRGRARRAGWPPRCSSGAWCSAPTRCRTARARSGACSTCCSSRRRWARPARGCMWSGAPWYAGHSLADQRDAGVLMLVGGGLALAAITVAVAWAAILREHRRQLAVRGGGRPREARVARCGRVASPCAAARWRRGRPPPGASRSPAAAAGRVRPLWPAARVLFAQGCASLPRRGPARAPGARARRCAAPERRRPTSTCRPGACRSPTRPTSPSARSPPTRAPTSTRSSPSSAPSAGPAIPRVDPARGSLATGHGEVHRALRRLPPDRRARRASSPAPPSPRCDDTTPTQLAEAVRVGPYLMPKFSARQIDQATLDSIAALRRSRSATRTTAAAGASATSGRCPRGWSRGSWPWPSCSRSRA